MGLFGAIGEYQAAKASRKGAEQSLAYMRAEREKAQKRGEELYGEYLPAGGMGMDALRKRYDVLVGGDISQFQESPGYQFAMEQGTKALERGASARGGLLGGRQAKELTRYGTGMAMQEFGNWLNQLSRLSQEATDIGMGGAGGIMQQYGGVTGGQVGQAMQNVGLYKGMQRQAPWQGMQSLQDELLQGMGMIAGTQGGVSGGTGGVR
jgi:hypothetical protein